MRTVALVMALLMVAGVAAASMNLTDHMPPRKNAGSTGNPTYEGRDGGENIATAVVIPSLPFSDTGNTCPYLDDYDEVCPYSGGAAPDVVYAYTPAADEYIDIDLCASLYDTKVFVYEDSYTPGAPYACNDDACGDDGWKSLITGMPVFAGSTYYIVVDGYGTSCGDYILDVDISQQQPCIVECPAWGVDEGEVDCFDQYDDTYNGGCNVVPPVFQSIDLNTTICGNSGNFMYDDGTGPAEYRDMDWYELVLTEDEHVEVCVCADFPARVWIVDGNSGCDFATVLVSEAAAANFTLCVDQLLTAGTYWVLVSIDGWLGIPCGVEYVANIYEFGYTPVEPTSWGTIKSIYR
ncbi:MAG: hypothetical protein GF405_01560 [Candidatus Eisenbacteria bacterium]|nr:hypothetical protein [Candidatus Eisenbacteria bacterium]